MYSYSDRDPTPTNSAMNNFNVVNSNGGRGGLGANIRPNGTAAIGSEMAQRKLKQEQMQQRLGDAANHRFPPQDMTPAHAVVEDAPSDGEDEAPANGQNLSNICFKSFTGMGLKAWDEQKKQMREAAGG